MGDVIPALAAAARAKADDLAGANGGRSRAAWAGAGGAVNWLERGGDGGPIDAGLYRVNRREE